MRAGLPIIIFFVALLLRLPWLEDRPFHVDEANNAFIIQELIRQGRFEYRTHDHHGPTFFYLSSLPLIATGVTTAAQMDAWMLRAITVVFGAASCAAVFLLVPVISRQAAVAAALFMAFAAPFDFFSRIFIPESILLLFTILFLAGVARWWMTGKVTWAAFAGVAAGLMVATKENAAVSVILMGGPFLIFPKATLRQWGAGFLSMGAAALAAVAALLGPANLLEAIPKHIQRGMQSGHEHPWWQFFFGLALPTGLPGRGASGFRSCLPA